MYSYLPGHWPNELSVCQWRPGFNPRAGHTKDSKKWYLILFTQPLRSSIRAASINEKENPQRIQKTKTKKKNPTKTAWHSRLGLQNTSNASLPRGKTPPTNVRISYLPNPSARAGYDTRSVFKRGLTGLNSEFSFSKTSCLTKAEENQSVLLFTHSWRENNWIHTFPKGISAMWNAIILVQDLNSCRHIHFLRR